MRRTSLFYRIEEEEINTNNVQGVSYENNQQNNNEQPDELVQLFNRAKGTDKGDKLYYDFYKNLLDQQKKGNRVDRSQFFNDFNDQLATLMAEQVLDYAISGGSSSDNKKRIDGVGNGAKMDSTKRKILVREMVIAISSTAQMPGIMEKLDREYCTIEIAKQIQPLLSREIGTQVNQMRFVDKQTNIHVNHEKMSLVCNADIEKKIRTIITNYANLSSSQERMLKGISPRKAKEKNQCNMM